MAVLIIKREEVERVLDAIGGAEVNDIINARPDPANPNTPLFASLGIPWLSDNPPVRVGTHG